MQRLVQLGIEKCGVNQPVAVIDAASDFDRMGIAAQCCELRFLHAVESSARVENENLHSVKAVECVGDGSSAVACGCYEHVYTLVAAVCG